MIGIRYALAALGGVMISRGYLGDLPDVMLIGTLMALASFVLAIAEDRSRL